MASTNKTANYNLSQFIGSDKPAWLGDYNSDMNKIDTAIKSAADSATAASGEATSAGTAIGTLTNLTTDEKTNLVGAINEVDSHADTAQNTANTASTIATNAVAGVNNLASLFDLSTFVTLTGSSSQLNPSSVDVTCAKNSEGSIAKIYGRVRFSGGYNGTITLTLSDTGLRPGSPITFNGCALRLAQTSGGNTTYSQSYTLNTNGTITINVASSSSTSLTDIYMIACVLFITDFGDVVPSE